MVYLTVVTPGQPPPKNPSETEFDFWVFDDLMDAVGYILSMGLKEYELSDMPQDPIEYYTRVAPHSTERV
jgi:hypothetical protein